MFCLNVLEYIKQFYLLMWFKKTRLEAPFKNDDVKALIKTSHCENLVLYFFEKVQKIAAFAMLFLVFSDKTHARTHARTHTHTHAHTHIIDVDEDSVSSPAG